MKMAAFAAVALAVTSPALAATTFDMEGVALGYSAGSLTVVDGATTLTVTPDGNPTGFIFVTNPGVPLLGTKAVVGSQVNPINSGQFSALRFTFSQLVDSVTFNFGDNGGDDDSPVTISAFSAGNVLLGSVTDTYPTGFNAGKSQTLNFLGVKYYIASSGSNQNNENSILWDISNFRVSVANAVPEPASWAMMLIGFGVVGATLRRRQSANFKLA